jgi:hypothetical protein
VSVISACEWSAIAMNACSAKKESTPPAASITRASWRSAAAIEVSCPSGPRLCECQSLSGSDSSRKSNRSCSTMYADTQPEWRSRTPGMPSVERQPVRREANTSA